MEWIRAIARISLGDGSHGTGFLISAGGLVMTAFHVVALPDKSKTARAPVWRKGPIAIKFGNPLAPKTQWTTGDATVYLQRFSIDDDWVLLEIPPPPPDVAPLQLADFDQSWDGKPFNTFGFPTMKAEIGGGYDGRVLSWPSGPGRAELDAQNLIAEAAGGEKAGGISGAPVIVDRRAVGILVQSLTNAQGQATSRSLYAVPLARAADSLKGLVAWDDGKPVVFQDVVVRKLPSDPQKLEAAAGRLGLPNVREKAPIARRMLAAKLDVARDALVECDLDGKPAGMILERVAAMSLNDGAVKQLRAPTGPGGGQALAILSCAEAQIHKWYVQRAYSDRRQREDGETIIVLRRASADAEQASGTALQWIIAQVRTRLRGLKLGDQLVDQLLSPGRVEGLQGLWIVLVGENRPEVVGQARDQLPNAHIILGLHQTESFPPPYENLAVAVSPVMSEQEQRDLVLAWQDAAGQLQAGIEPKVDP
jgi:hypothetical protein